MPKIKYREFKFRPATLAMIKKANEIIAEYAAQGFDLTLRQMYYQFVSCRTRAAGRSQSCFISGIWTQADEI